MNIEGEKSRKRIKTNPISQITPLTARRPPAIILVRSKGPEALILKALRSF
jgi:hypothetical protein